MRIVEILGEVLGIIGDFRLFKDLDKSFPALGGILAVLVIVFVVLRVVRVFRKISGDEGEFAPLPSPREVPLEGPEDRRGIWIRR